VLKEPQTLSQYKKTKLTPCTLCKDKKSRF
jgi:hypothetical protein